MPNYLVADCPAARRFFSNLGRSPAVLGPYLLISLSDEEVAAAKAANLQLFDDLTGEEI
jgi:hypothetical protein